MPGKPRRLLVVSPHFPPSNTADSQRVRMLLPFFRENGWETTVLAVQPEQVAAPLDPWLEEWLPNDVRVMRVRALGLGWQRIPGLGTLDLRALGALRKGGDRLLSKGRFDLIYFSTTVFGIHLLGPRWKQRFGVPFVIDYQDPWVSDYYDQHPDVIPPGGRIKYTLSQWLARRSEPKVLRACAGITSVSPEYPRQLKARYPELQSLKALVLPFPGSIRDFERAPKGGVDLSERWDEKKTNWVYVGRAGPDMESSLSALFQAIAE